MHGESLSELNFLFFFLLIGIMIRDNNWFCKNHQSSPFNRSLIHCITNAFGFRFKTLVRVLFFRILYNIISSSHLVIVILFCANFSLIYLIDFPIRLLFSEVIKQIFFSFFSISLILNPPFFI